MGVVMMVPPFPETLQTSGLPHIDYADAFLMRLPAGRHYTLDQAVLLVLTAVPGWVKQLFSLRNLLMQPFGLKTGDHPPVRRPDTMLLPGAHLGVFRVFERRADELLLGEDDRHLDFRLSLRLREDNAQQWAIVTTIVHFHNRWGRTYFVVVEPFHRLIVLALMRGARRRAAAA